MQDPAAGAAVEQEAVAAEPPAVATLRQAEVSCSGAWPGLSAVVLPGMPKLSCQMCLGLCAPSGNAAQHQVCACST